jgi:hypothetical protein
MATVDGVTAARAQTIEDNSVVSGVITGGVLVLTTGDGTQITVGTVNDGTHYNDPNGVHGVGGSSAIVGTLETQTLSGKTLVTPTIASFVNAPHNHTNAANGGSAWTFSGFKDIVDIGGQVITNSQAEWLGFGGPLVWDTDSYSVSNTQFNIPATGYYDILVQVSWDGNNTNRRAIELRLNDTSVSPNVGTIGKSVAKVNDSPGHGATFVQQLRAHDHFVAGDKLKVFVYQNSGVGLTILGSDDGTDNVTFITITRRG